MNKKIKTIICCILTILFMGGTIIAVCAEKSNAQKIAESYLSEVIETTEEAYSKMSEPTTKEPETQPTIKVLLGDLGGDNKITAGDARLILRASARLIELTPEQSVVADVDFDGHITAADARRTLRYSAKLISSTDFLTGRDILEQGTYVVG